MIGQSPHTPHPSEQSPQGEIPDYGNVSGYWGRPASIVAAEVFGDDMRNPGTFYSGDGDNDVPYKIQCAGQGKPIGTFNMLHGTDEPAGWEGLNHPVISREEAIGMVHPSSSPN